MSPHSSSTGSNALVPAERLRLIVITDPDLRPPRTLLEVVSAALRAGAPAIQLRDKTADARRLAETARSLLALTRPAEALLFVNDRLDVALAVGADGVHVGPDDLPVRAARRAIDAAAVPVSGAAGFLVGTSTDSPVEAAALVEAGADYIGCGTVFPTTSKSDAGQVIGIDRLQAVVRAVDVPVIGIGGVTPERARTIADRTDAAGVAVIGAVMKADDVEAAVRDLLAPWRATSRPLPGSAPPRRH